MVRLVFALVCYCDGRKLYSIWCSFFWNCPATTKCKDLMPLASIHPTLYQMHALCCLSLCFYFTFIPFLLLNHMHLVVVPKRIHRQNHFDNHIFLYRCRLLFFAVYLFGSSSRTNLLLVLLFGRSYGLWMWFYFIRSMNTHLNFHSIYRWNQCHIKYFISNGVVRCMQLHSTRCKVTFITSVFVWMSVCVYRQIYRCDKIP